MILAARNTITSLASVISLFSLLAIPANAQETSPEQDNSGTNPTKINRNFSISNDFQKLPTDAFINTTTLNFTQPLGDLPAGVRFKLPFKATDITDDTEFGLGDFGVKVNWIPFVTRTGGFVLQGEITAPTATETVLGTGKWVTSPGVTAVYFASESVIIAPAFLYSTSFAGDSDRPNISRGDFDLYAVYKPKGASWWLTSDVTISYDFKNKKIPASWELQYGMNLGKVGNAALNGYIRPGIGIGRDRPYDWSVDVGVSLVGF